jgi:hypothetical protein
LCTWTTFAPFVAPPWQLGSPSDVAFFIIERDILHVLGV